jgi:hypothetical protein
MQGTWMLGDVSKVRVHWDEVVENLRLTKSPAVTTPRKRLTFPVAWQASDPIYAHQYRHQGRTDVHAHAKSQFVHDHGREL